MEAGYSDPLTNEWDSSKVASEKVDLHTSGTGDGNGERPMGATSLLA